MNNRVREISEHKRDNITVNEANKKCGECKRYGDLHSSCFKVRNLKVQYDDEACVDFI